MRLGWFVMTTRSPAYNKQLERTVMRRHARSAPPLNRDVVRRNSIVGAFRWEVDMAATTIAIPSREPHRFYAVLAWIFAAVTLLSFVPTYWQHLGAGQVDGCAHAARWTLGRAAAQLRR